VFLSNANITSRLTSDPFTEVLMLMDEPHSPANLAVPLVPCDAAGVTLGICTILGTGSGAGTYNGTAGRPNVFQARLTGVNQVTFFGVPIDPPGTSGHRIIRITNLRGNNRIRAPLAAGGACCAWHSLALNTIHANRPNAGRTPASAVFPRRGRGRTRGL